MAKFRHDDITYELFGIDPQKFYKTKFKFGKSISHWPYSVITKYDLNFSGMRLLIDGLHKHYNNTQQGRILDIGCGSGPLGPTLRCVCPNITLHGIDLSEACLHNAAKNGYQECLCFDLTKPLPFPNNYFDAVISTDFWGHIEFRYKDTLIAEIARTTKNNGMGFHGAETGYIDYLNCDPNDENDGIRKYVFIDGHIGVEPAAHLKRRFLSHYKSADIDITPIYPFFDLDNLSNKYCRIFEDDFAEYVRSRNNKKTRELVSVILGRINQYFIEKYKKAFGEHFMPCDEPGEEEWPFDFPGIPRELFRPAGYTFYTLTK